MIPPDLFSSSGTGTTKPVKTRTAMNETSGGSETILLVEDEELLLELIQSMLQMHGYKIITAKDGKTAVEVFRQHHNNIDLVLTDLGLPGIGGWEACQQMREIRPDLKVIVATGYLETGAREEMMGIGTTECVQKPYLAKELASKVREVLDSGK